METTFVKRTMMMDYTSLLVIAIQYTIRRTMYGVQCTPYNVRCTLDDIPLACVKQDHR